MALSDCEKCWDTPCTCGYGYRNYTQEAKVKLAAAVLQMSADDLSKALRPEALTSDFKHSGACAWWLDWNENKPPKECRPCSCGGEARRALQGVARYLERGWLSPEGRCSEALRVAKIGLGEETIPSPQQEKT